MVRIEAALDPENPAGGIGIRVLPQQLKGGLGVLAAPIPVALLKGMDLARRAAQREQPRAVRLQLTVEHREQRLQERFPAGRFNQAPMGSRFGLELGVLFGSPLLVVGRGWAEPGHCGLPLDVIQAATATNGLQLAGLLGRESVWIELYQARHLHEVCDRFIGGFFAQVASLTLALVEC